MSTNQGRGTAWMLLLLAVTQVVMTAVQFSGGRSPGGRGVDLLISPAPYAFGIWAVIYLLCVLHGAVVVRFGTGVADGPALIVPLAGLYLASAVWSVAFTVGNSWLTFAVLVVMTIAAWRALWVATRSPARANVPGWTGGLERFTVGLYSGWVTVAVFVNLASAIGDQGLADPASAGWQFAVLIAALIALLAGLWLGRGPAGFAVAAVWALAAVAVSVSGVSVLLMLTSLAGVLAVAVAGVWLRGGHRGGHFVTFPTTSPKTR